MFTSTRSKISVSASKAILKGLAIDGGLFIPNSTQSDFFGEHLLTCSYQALSSKLLRVLLDDFSDSQIEDIVNNSYNQKNFQKQIVKIKDLDNYAYLELYHGNTFAFKDMALSMLPNLFNESKKINDITKKTIILTATSGDTGSAALNGFGNLEDTYVIVLYPTNGVSPFQELQMTNFQSDKHKVLAIDGNFDDCQNIVKEIFNTVRPENILLSSANSINIGRIIPQIIYYFHTYIELVKRERIQFGDDINFTVPTGNFGNIYAGYLAKQLGLPIKKLVIASNENNILTDLFQTKEYNLNRPLHQTISPSMDIIISSNLERYLYNIYQEDPTKITEIMNSLRKNRHTIIDQINNDRSFYADFANEEQTKFQIKETFINDQYLIDPHTAVAKYVSEQYIKNTKDSTYMVVVSTANPYKFSNAILDALSLPKKSTLKENLLHIQEITKSPLDDNILEVIDSKPNKIEIPLNDAYQFVKKVIGDLDDKN
jgi:threonine synthase